MLAYKFQQPHVSGPLNGLRQHFLELKTDARIVPGNNLAVFGNILFQQLDVLVINIFRSGSCKWAFFVILVLCHDNWIG